MALRETVFNDLTEAQKKGDADTVSVLRLFIAAIRNKEIEKRAEIAGEDAALTDEEVQKLARQEMKKRKEAAALYEKGGRSELAKKEQKELDILSRYVPPELSEEDVRKEVERVIEETGAEGKKDFGKVMGLAMKKLGSQADGNMVSKIVRELLR